MNIKYKVIRFNIDINNYINSVVHIYQPYKLITEVKVISDEGEEHYLYIGLAKDDENTLELKDVLRLANDVLLGKEGVVKGEFPHKEIISHYKQRVSGNYGKLTRLIVKPKLINAIRKDILGLEKNAHRLITPRELKEKLERMQNV